MTSALDLSGGGINAANLPAGMINDDGHHGSFSDSSKRPQDNLVKARASMNAILSFKETDLEAAYAKYFVDKHLKSWRAAVFLIFMATTLLYTYSMIKSNQDQQFYSGIQATRTMTFSQEDLKSAISLPGYFW